MTVLPQGVHVWRIYWIARDIPIGQACSGWVSHVCNLNFLVSLGVVFGCSLAIGRAVGWHLDIPLVVNGIGTLAHKISVVAPHRAKHDESGANWNRPWRKASLLLLIRGWRWPDASQEFPACLGHSLRCRTTPKSGRERFRAWPKNTYLLRD